MNLLALHAVFGHDAVEMLLDDGHTLGILFVALVDIESDTNRIIRECITKFGFNDLSGLWFGAAGC